MSTWGQRISALMLLLCLNVCVCSKAAAAVLPYLRIITELLKRQFHMATLPVKKNLSKNLQGRGLTTTEGF